MCIFFVSGSCLWRSQRQSLCSSWLFSALFPALLGMDALHRHSIVHNIIIRQFLSFQPIFRILLYVTPGSCLTTALLDLPLSHKAISLLWGLFKYLFLANVVLLCIYHLHFLYHFNLCKMWTLARNRNLEFGCAQCSRTSCCLRWQASRCHSNIFYFLVPSISEPEFMQ